MSGAAVVVGRQRRWERVLYVVVRSIVVGFAKLFWRLEIHGSQHVPATGPFVLCPVHRSNIDTPLAAAVTGRRLRAMGKDSLWKVEAAGRFLTALGGFPVHRGTADREALRRCQEVLEAGEPLLMFPEGTRRTGPIVEDMFDGPAFVAGRTGAVIVPVGIGGSERAMPTGSKLLKPVKIVMVVGEPIAPPRGDDGGRPSRRAIRDKTEELRLRIQELFDEAQAKSGA